MQAYLVRIGVDQAYGGWNAPVDPVTGEFVYVPIPEGAKSFHPGCRRTLEEFFPAIEHFQRSRELEISKWPTSGVRSADAAIHLDPDFEHLTYGDDGGRRGSGIATLTDGDLLVFYSGLKPVSKCEHKLLYAIVGFYVVKEVVKVDDVSSDRYHENAHTRKTPHYPKDIVVRAKRGQSGRLERCIPIGEWREGAYRVRNDLLSVWGGLTVKNGFIQRSAVPPRFLNPRLFQAWLRKQPTRLLRSNY